MGRERIIMFDFKGKICRFSILEIDRAMLHDSRRRIALDAQGRECRTALLTKDGRFLLPSGSTASLYINDSGDAVERDELVAIDGAGRRMSDQSGDEDEAPRLGATVATEELLDGVAHKVYALTPQALDPELERSLIEGDIYRVPYRNDKSNGIQPAFLLANGHGIFLLVTRPCRFEFVSLDQPVADWDEDNDAEDASDCSLDFDFDFGVGGV